MYVLIVGWFSMERSATAGDLIAADVVSGWLRDEGIPHDIALAPSYGSGVDWTEVDPERYSHVLVVCGPVHPSLRIARVLERFRSRPLIGVNVSMVQQVEKWNPFDLLLERDSDAVRRPDITLASGIQRVPIVGVVLAQRQPEYRGGMHAEATDAIYRFVSERGLAPIEIDTRLPNQGSTIIRTPAQIESLIARTDVVVTTRLHGMVIALRNGVPAVAIDPVANGAKVLAQAQRIGWPAVVTADRLSHDVLEELFDYCLTPEAREQATRCARGAAEDLVDVRETLLRRLSEPELLPDGRQAGVLRPQAVPAPSGRIPRTIHRIWLSDKPMPSEFVAYGETWALHHPGWDMRLWTDESIAEFQSEALARCRNPAEKSDVLRYEILSRFGGVYVDTDVECVRSIEPLLDGVTAFAGYKSKKRVGTAVLGSVPGHPAIMKARDEIALSAGFGDQIEATGPGFLTRILSEFPDVRLYPPETFYALSWDDQPPDPLPPGAYAIHRPARSWMPEPQQIEFLLRRLHRARRQLERARRQRDKAWRRASLAEERLRKIEAHPVLRYLRVLHRSGKTPE